MQCRSQLVGLSLAAILLILLPRYASALDFESFEFTDPAGAKLANAANTASPGNNWFEGGAMDKSDIRSGSYHVVKNTTGLASNYLQISNITGGTRYLVARMSGWNFYDDGGPLEEVRFAFLNDDTGNSGATITAQATIRRDADRNIVIVGTALGAGSADITGSHLLNVPDQFGESLQTNPFTVVLELNKDANSYKVFYKDGTNPTQVLGLGAVAPTRGGNSIRFAVNNNVGSFNDDYPLQPAYEYFSIDRLALSDANPLTDLISLEVDRTTASMTLRNTSGATISGIQSYSITSAAGGLNPAGWSTGGATPTTSNNEELAASFNTPINLTNGQTLTLSTGPGAWLKSPFEDLQMVLNLAGGQTRTVNVNFLENGGMKWGMADFDFDGAIDGDDWLHFIANAETNIAGLSRIGRYLRGDLTDDGKNSIADFVQFKSLYDMANGAGSFEAMLAEVSVPEPASIMLLGTALVVGGALRRRRAGCLRHRSRVSPMTSYNRSIPGAFTMRRAAKALSFLTVVVLLVASPRAAHAVILEDFQFNDDNGTLLADTVNAVNPANGWIVETSQTALMTNSFVQNGVYRVQKDTTGLGRNVLDITNNVATGKGWIVAEIAGWSFSSGTEPGGFDASNLEHLRITFLNNDTGLTNASSFVTAEARIQRTTAGGLQLFGTALGTGGTNVSGTQPPLPLNQAQPFTLVLELDKNANEYSIFYKNASDSAFSLFGTATVAPDRAGNSMRLSYQGRFDGAGEFFDLDRIYATTTNPLDLPVIPTVLTLEVKSNGQVAIRNDTNAAISFNSYRIESPTADLNFAGWNSLSDQNLDVLGSGDGQSWDEAGGSSDSVLAESFLLGSSTIAQGGSPIPLGNAFQPGGNHEQLLFQYHDINTGVIVTGEIDFVTVAALEGDYNNDGKVDAADYVLWRKNGINGQQGYNTWRANFGMTAGSGSGLAGGSVPEPASVLLVILTLLAAAARSRS